MDEWSKIDLHIHTQKGKTYNNESEAQDTGKYFNIKNFILRNNVNELKLTSIANHNLINIIQLIKIAYASKYSQTNVLPGVELDVKIYSEKRYHIVLVFSEKVDIIKISSKLELFIKENNENCLSIQDLFDLISNTECIIIPHGCKNPHGLKAVKEDEIDINDAMDLINIITSSSILNVLFEHTKPYYGDTFKSHLIEMAKTKWLSVEEIEELENRAGSQYVGSDYRFSKPIIEKENRILTKIWANPTFRGLQISCIFPNERIKPENDIVSKVNYIKNIKIDKSSNFDESNIELSSGLNSIIGESASGKTALLDIITNNLSGAPVVQGKNYDDLCKDINVKFYNQDGYPLKKGDINIIVAQNLYDSIRTAQDKGNNQEILKLFKFEVNNTSLALQKYEKKLLFCENCYRDIINSTVKIQELSLDIKERNSILLLNKQDTNDNLIINIPVFSMLQKKNGYIRTGDIITKYINELENLQIIQSDLKYKLSDLKIKNELDNIMEQLTKEIKRIKKLISNEIIRLNYNQMIFNKASSIIENANNKINQKNAFILSTKKKLIEQTDSLLESLKKYIVNKYKINSSNLNFPEEKIIEELKEKNKHPYVEILYPSLKDILVLDDDSGLFNIKSISRLLKDYKGKLVFQDKEIKEVIRLLLSNDKKPEFRIKDILTAITNKSEIKIGFPNEEKINVADLTPGLTAKMYIDYLFNVEIINGINNIVIFDQPENDVDKAFIYQELIPKISDAKFKLQVIITSHEPLLVINGDSNEIIRAEKQNRKIQYKSYKLDEYLDKDTVTNVISKYVDGHVNAVKNRYEIYVGGKNEYKFDLQ